MEILDNLEMPDGICKMPSKEASKALEERLFTMECCLRSIKFIAHNCLRDTLTKEQANELLRRVFKLKEEAFLVEVVLESIAKNEPLSPQHQCMVEWMD